MKNIANTLLVLAAVAAVLGIISRVTSTMIIGLGVRSFVGLAALLLLFVIALGSSK